MEQNSIKEKAAVKLTAKDFVSDQEVKWCPGCGDYIILKQLQNVLPEFVSDRAQVVFISGIGCSSRFPYYMNTYGMHGIHGRAAAIATGLKVVNRDLSVWVITGDGDSLSIGGNHFIHVLRRNPGIKLMLFNNQIYGLTKGQYSPTSEKGKVTKSTPYGSVDEPFNPAELALGAKASFFARTIDHEPKQMQEIFRRANCHHGTACMEIYQNCPVFNDGAFALYTDRNTKKENRLLLEQGQPLVFGESDNKGIKLDGTQPVVVDLNDGFSKDDLWVHDEANKELAFTLAHFADRENEHLPRPFGVLYCKERPCFEDDVQQQIDEARQKTGTIPLDQILSGNKTWTIW